VWLANAGLDFSAPASSDLLRLELRSRDQFHGPIGPVLARWKSDHVVGRATQQKPNYHKRDGEQNGGLGTRHVERIDYVVRSSAAVDVSWSFWCFPNRGKDKLHADEKGADDWTARMTKQRLCVPRLLHASIWTNPHLGHHFRDERERA